MHKLLRTAALLLSLTLAGVPAHAATPVPKPLLAQVARLVELLRDNYATGYPEATMVQMVSPSQDRKLALAVFTIEAYGGGNNHQQFFAVFEHELDKAGHGEHYTLVEVMSIGAKGWRAIMELKAKVVTGTDSQEVQFLIPAREVGPGDALNFPSRESTIKLVLNKRLTEIKP
ncbi:hypothetical protein ACWV27_05755 [Massilia varians]|jgi:hypothetical protein